MPPRKPAKCEVCNVENARYSCPACFIPYCSVECFKDHKATSCSTSNLPGSSKSPTSQLLKLREEKGKGKEPQEEELTEPSPLRYLTSLKWPYIPDEPSYDDPLKRDEPKALKMWDYEAIATSEAIRKALSSHPNLPPLLRKIDKLRGAEREEALERLLGVSPDSHKSTRAESEDDKTAMKELAEAVEKCVRGEKPDALGLDWEEKA